MNNYLANAPEQQQLSIAISYLDCHAHEWWIVYKDTEEGRSISSWPELKDALIKRFETLNKETFARDRLAKWKQLKDAATFNDDFKKIILDILNISVDKRIDRYTRGLKSYIWKELCTNEYTKLADAMRDAERVESAPRKVKPSDRNSNKPGGASNKFPAPEHPDKEADIRRTRKMHEGRPLLPLSR